jgi:hypothetical protein
MRHGPVELVSRPIADESGAVARPYRTIDILAAMERRGTITPEMRAAGEDFRARFRQAHLDPLRAADLARAPRVGYAGRASDSRGFAEYARTRTWRVILALGGLGSPAGSCLWHVVGLEYSLKQWALETGWSGRRVPQDMASGILIAALGALEHYWRGSLPS